LSYDLSFFLQLKKEVFQLAQQLEQARSEIKDLRRMVEEEKTQEKETLSTETEGLNVCYIHLLILLSVDIYILLLLIDSLLSRF